MIHYIWLKIYTNQTHVPPLKCGWNPSPLSIQTAACILSLFINEEQAAHSKPETSAEAVLGQMKNLYIQVVLTNGFGYKDFLDELKYKFDSFSVTEDEFFTSIKTWREVYGRTFTLVHTQKELVESAFGLKDADRNRLSILSKVAYRQISIKSAFAKLASVDNDAAQPLGAPVEHNLAEYIVEIANQFGIFQDKLTVEAFNQFIAGTLSTPLRASNNTTVAIFLHGLVEVQVLKYGAYSKISAQESILSSTGKKPLSNHDITVPISKERKEDNPRGVHAKLKKKLRSLKEFKC